MEMINAHHKDGVQGRRFAADNYFVLLLRWSVVNEIYNHLSGGNSVGLLQQSHGADSSVAHEEEYRPVFFTLLVCDSFLSKLFWSVMSYYPDYILMCPAELECYVRPGGHVIPAHFDTENALWTFLSD